MLQPFLVFLRSSLQSPRALPISLAEVQGSYPRLEPLCQAGMDRHRRASVLDRRIVIRSTSQFLWSYMIIMQTLMGIPKVNKNYPTHLVMLAIQELEDDGFFLRSRHHEQEHLGLTWLVFGWINDWWIVRCQRPCTSVDLEDNSNFTVINLKKNIANARNSE